MYKSIDPITVYENLTMICQAKGLSVKKMCKYADVSYETVRKRWKAYLPSLSLLMKVANFLCVSVDDILIREKCQDLLVEIENNGRKKMTRFSIRNQIKNNWE